MAKRKTGIKTGKEGTGQIAKRTPQSIAVAERGIKTGRDLADVLSVLIGDVLAGRISPATTNAACNVTGKLLKVVEMQHKYGKPGGGLLRLTS